MPEPIEVIMAAMTSAMQKSCFKYALKMEKGIPSGPGDELLDSKMVSATISGVTASGWSGGGFYLVSPQQIYTYPGGGGVCGFYSRSVDNGRLLCRPSQQGHR